MGRWRRPLGTDGPQLRIVHLGTGRAKRAHVGQRTVQTESRRVHHAEILEQSGRDHVALTTGRPQYAETIGQVRGDAPPPLR